MGQMCVNAERWTHLNDDRKITVRVLFYLPLPENSAERESWILADDTYYEYSEYRVLEYMVFCTE